MYRNSLQRPIRRKLPTNRVSGGADAAAIAYFGAHQTAQERLRAPISFCPCRGGAAGKIGSQIGASAPATTRPARPLLGDAARPPHRERHRDRAIAR